MTALEAIAVAVLGLSALGIWFLWVWSDSKKPGSKTVVKWRNDDTER